MEKESLKKDLLLDSVWQLETAEADLEETIDFLHCIDEEYLNSKQTKESAQYLYWQFGSILRTLRKSIEYTSMNMRKSIEAIYEEKSKEGASNVND